MDRFSIFSGREFPILDLSQKQSLSSLIHDKQTLGILSPDINISLIKMLYFDNERKRQSKPSKKPCTFQGRAEMGSSRDFLVPHHDGLELRSTPETAHEAPGRHPARAGLLRDRPGAS